ncbi:MAG TPA: 5-formyltetrahydrofolate cyclo-ligase [Bacilli bacterium]|nr:5-formyltetrahydrofolate cyclo-ligase [Bacilli bacterium]
MDKKELRHELLANRKALAPQERADLDAGVLQNLLALPEMQKAQTILAYLDFRGEVDSSGLIEWALREGKTICAPVTVKEERRLIPVQMSSLQEVRFGAYGIREPIMTDNNVIEIPCIDVVVIPGVGFDRQGGRLGYGGGYYDRFLPRLREGVVKIAVAYELQILPQVPLEPHDTLLDMLVTEQGVWRREG